MIRDPSDGSIARKHKGPTCKACGVEFYYDYTPQPNDYTGYCEDCVPPIADLKTRPTSAENWGLKSLDQPPRKPKPAPTKEELEAHYATHNLAFQPKQTEGT